MGSFTPHGYTVEMGKLYHACAALGMGPRASRTVAEWTESLDDAASKTEEFWLSKHGCGPHTALEIMDHLAVPGVEKSKAVSPIPMFHEPAKLTPPTERIVAAAIQVEGLTISLPQPARHGHVHMACEAAHIPVDVYLRGTQGFLTSTGRFVNRVMAKHIAHIAGQPQLRPEKERHQRDLFSEDLW